MIFDILAAKVRLALGSCVCIGSIDPSGRKYESILVATVVVVVVIVVVVVVVVFVVDFDFVFVSVIIQTAVGFGFRR